MCLYNSQTQNKDLLDRAHSYKPVIYLVVCFYGQLIDQSKSRLQQHHGLKKKKKEITSAMSEGGQLDLAMDLLSMEGKKWT